MSRKQFELKDLVVPEGPAWRDGFRKFQRFLVWWMTGLGLVWILWPGNARWLLSRSDVRRGVGIWWTFCLCLVAVALPLPFFASEAPPPGMDATTAVFSSGVALVLAGLSLRMAIQPNGSKKRLAICRGVFAFLGVACLGAAWPNQGVLITISVVSALFFLAASWFAGEAKDDGKPLPSDEFCQSLNIL